VSPFLEFLIKFRASKPNFLKGIQKRNQKAFSNAQKIQKFEIFPVDFSIPGGELGPTLKLKRSHVLLKYASLIQSIYADG